MTHCCNQPVFTTATATMIIHLRMITRPVLKLDLMHLLLFVEPASTANLRLHIYSLLTVKPELDQIDSCRFAEPAFRLVKNFPIHLLIATELMPTELLPQQLFTIVTRLIPNLRHNFSHSLHEVLQVDSNHIYCAHHVVQNSKVAKLTAVAAIVVANSPISSH